MERLRQTISVRWDTLGIDADELSLTEQGTVCTRAAVSPPDSDAAPFLADGHQLEYQGTVGKGGNAVVRLAIQQSLGRQVAVKALRDDRPDHAATELLREARTLGALAHPNVVPVHMLGRDDDGKPIVVMKRVEGTPWISWIGAGGRLDSPEEGDALEWHLRVLMIACSVAQFAHDRGVVHRDLKPRNIMIGTLGEVYVLDWGLAARFRDDCVVELPAISDERDVVGTPGFLAPEMVLVRTDEMGPRTDVYQLGATLHTVLTGASRHPGSDLMTRLLMAAQSAPWPYPDSVPSELADIANRACSRRPDDRYESAEAMREAVAAFLRHRESARLAAAATKRLERLRACLDAESREARDQFQALLGECRFGFKQALVTWEDNEAAIQALEETNTLAVREALQAGDIDRAGVLLSALSTAPPELVARLETLRSERARANRELEQLRALEREVDPAVAVGFRALICAGICGFWGVVFSILAWLQLTGRHADSPVLVTTLISLHGAAIGILTVRFWGVWDSTSVNRRFLWALAFSAVAAGALWAASLYIGMRVAHGVAFVQFSFSAACAIAAVAIDMRLLAAAAGFALGFVFTLLYPDAYWLVIDFAAFSATGSLAFVWGRDWRRLRG